MIPKGSQRAGGQQLATHLLNEFDNDRVEVAHVRGAIAPDLHGAFAEWSATATGTRCRKYLYSLSVNPDPEQGPLTRAQYLDFIERTENQLGLTGQPRALIFHVKHGREHCHAVWSRIDTDKMRAVQLSHDRHALRTVVMEFARDHGLELPKGVTRDRTRDEGPRRPAENLAEKQQEERTGQTRDERMRAVTDAWNQSRDAQSLIAALEERGYLLARGNRRAYVIVDRFGEIHALARQIDGARAKDVKARLTDYPIDKLPDAKKAQAFAREQREAVQKDLSAVKTLAQQRRDALAAAHAKRRALVDQKRGALEKQHRLERETLGDAQETQKRGIASKRLAARPKGVLAFLTRITGIQILVDRHQHRQDVHRIEEHRQQSAALKRRHAREMQDFGRHYRALDKLDARERRSLETKLRREEFARIARGIDPPTPQLPPPDLIRAFREAASGPSPPEAKPDPDPKPEPKRAPDKLSPDFNERAAGRATPNQSARGGKRPDPDRGEEAPPGGTLSDEFDRALKRRAMQKRKEQDRERQADRRRGPGRDRGL